jgi:hypothetical protein
MKKLKNSIRSLDMFGMAIHLKFDGKSDVHYTIPGGIFSIILYIVYAHRFSTLFQ